MEQLTLWTNKCVTPQVRIENVKDKQLILRKMAQLLLEVVLAPSIKNEKEADDE